MGEYYSNLQTDLEHIARGHEVLVVHGNDIVEASLPHGRGGVAFIAHFDVLPVQLRGAGGGGEGREGMLELDLGAHAKQALCSLLT